ncbi:MAG: hypothetical protein COB84_03130 [Rhodobacteraceae bacterium]|nr:MAG: hypothetical protein COB84_03130 [Paracoccaceae bacterium]
MRNIFTITLLAVLLAACGPYLGGKTPVTFVTIGGQKYNVQKDPDNLNWWGSEYAQFVKATLNPITRVNNHVAAIEKVSGCKVKRETIITQMAAIVILNAEVVC